ncbi:WD40 repeat [Trinorchestia longiramus]|nr:WD40 repeat [Trinorchestia longiramus]
MPSTDEVQRHSVHTLVFRSLKRTHDMFLCEQGNLPPPHLPSEQFKRAIKSKDQYGSVLHRVAKAKKAAAAAAAAAAASVAAENGLENSGSTSPLAIEGAPGARSAIASAASQALVPAAAAEGSGGASTGGAQQLALRKAPVMPRPRWHAPWKLSRVISGHGGWVRCVDVEPGNEWFCTGSQDRIIKIWDMASGSHDKTIRLWDLAAGRSMCTLTHHKKSVRAVALHPTLYMFASAGADNIKQWKCPKGEFVQSLTGHNAIINCLSINSEGVMVSGANNGTMYFWDWRTGHNFQKLQAPVQPGSMDSEAGVYAMTFDQSGSRLITCDADKTIKIYKEDEDATEETHPVIWRPEIMKRRKY